MKSIRESELVNVLDANPSLLGIGLDDDISLIFTGNTFEILGKGIVAIYDNQKDHERWWYFLKPGTNSTLVKDKPFPAFIKPVHKEVLDFK
jgi:cyanophycinase-like exopeptidase